MSIKIKKLCKQMEKRELDLYLKKNKRYRLLTFDESFKILKKVKDNESIFFRIQEKDAGDIPISMRDLLDIGIVDTIEIVSKHNHIISFKATSTNTLFRLDVFLLKKTLVERISDIWRGYGTKAIR